MESREDRIPTEADLNINYPRVGKTFSRVVGISVPALLEVATRALGKESLVGNPSIRIFSHGGFNKLFLITFTDNTEVIARVPFVEGRSELKLKSEVATMMFIREHRDIPVAKIYDWKSDSQNVVGAPYILQERIRGVHLSGDYFFHQMSWEDRLRLVERLAQVHVELMKPLPFNAIGNIFLQEHTMPSGSTDSAISYTVGPLLPSQKHSDDLLHAPLPVVSSIVEVWHNFMKQEFSRAYQRWSRRTTDIIISEDDFGLKNGDKVKRTSDFADAFRDLHAILGALDIPPEFKRLCLWHNDLALRNMLFDPEDRTKIVAVLDWEDVSVVPCALAARYPEELSETGEWTVFPDDWTALQIPEDDFEIAGEEHVDTTWLRWYYGACVAKGNSIAGTRFWRENELAIKLNYIIFSGWTGWMRLQDWISEMALVTMQHHLSSSDNPVR